MTIAFLGLGNMGAGMAHCLVRAGHPLRVWNRSPDKMAAFEAAGAVACASPADAVRDTRLVISSLMDDDSVRSVFDGPEGVIKKMLPNAIHLCTATISPGCADRLAEAHRTGGSRFVAGPVVGRPDVAAEGTLIQFLSGDATAIEEVQPVCAAFTSMVLPIPGPASTAMKQKLCVNFFGIAIIEVMAECLTFAEKIGAFTPLLGLLFDQSLAHPGLKNYARKLIDRDIDGTGGFSMRGGLKDIGLILDAATQAGCPLDLATVIKGKMQECIERGLADADWSAIQEATRVRAGLPAQ